jgi:hypothetical protein
MHPPCLTARDRATANRPLHRPPPCPPAHPPARRSVLAVSSSSRPVSPRASPSSRRRRVAPSLLFCCLVVAWSRRVAGFLPEPSPGRMPCCLPAGKSQAIAAAGGQAVKRTPSRGPSPEGEDAADAGATAAQAPAEAVAADAAVAGPALASPPKGAAPGPRSAGYENPIWREAPEEGELSAPLEVRAWRGRGLH